MIFHRLSVKKLFALCSLFNLINLWAQVATHTYDLSQIASNPAILSSKKLSQFSLTTQYQQNVSLLKVPDGTNTLFDWEDDTTLTKQELIFFKSRGKTLFEFYLSANQGKKEIELIDKRATQKSSSSNDMSYIDNILNIAFVHKPWLTTGLKFSIPVMNYNSKQNYTNPDNTSFSFETNQRISFLTVGGGVTFKPFQYLHLGGFLTQTKEESSGKFTQTSASDSQANQRIKSSQDIQRLGFGISFLFPRTRWEISLTQMTIPEDREGVYPDSQKGVEYKTSFEFHQGGFSGGVHYRLTKNVFYDQNELVDRFLNEQIQNGEPTSSFGGFIGLSSKRGHSFSASGFYWQRTGQRGFQGQEVDAKTKTFYLGLGYAFIF
jgi:hypothetical protein